MPRPSRGSFWSGIAHAATLLVGLVACGIGPTHAPQITPWPGATPSSGRSGTLSWSLVGRAPLASVRWAPDGRHLLLVTQETNESIDKQRVTLMTSESHVSLQSYESDDAVD